MSFRKKKSPWAKEWEDLRKKEIKFTNKKMEGPVSVLICKLDRFIPNKMTSKMNSAFYKAFQLIFDKGTFVIEKTYSRRRSETDFRVNIYAAEISEEKRTVRKFTRKARSTKMLNLLLATLEGVGFGIVGCGIPDIPIYIGMILKSVYQIAISYGYSYDTDEEKVFILKVLQVSMMDEEDFVAGNDELNELIDQIVEDGDSLEGYIVHKDQQMHATADSMSQEMLYTKFLQTIPVAGIAGGIFNPVYMNRITDYAVLKYRRRFLRSRLARVRDQSGDDQKR